MRIAIFDARRFDREAFELAGERHAHQLVFFETRLERYTAGLAAGFTAVCPFVNDRLDTATLETLSDMGVRLVALRSAGYNNVDLVTAQRLDMRVARVPEYSPFAVAEHAFALLLSLVRKIPRAFGRVREANFSLEGLVGFDLKGKTMGVMGTGRIGTAVARIAHGFGCRLKGFDLHPNATLQREFGLRYVSAQEIYSDSDIISLHVPLNPATYHLINSTAFAQMKRGVVLLNTGRGALIDSRALIAALKTGQVGAAGLDVYEEEEGLFFRDLSNQVLQDDILARLLTFPNVIITSHQGFLTREALANIAETTLSNVDSFERGELTNEVRAEKVLQPVEPAPALLS